MTPTHRIVSRPGLALLLGIWSCSGINATADAPRDDGSENPEPPSGIGYIEVSIQTSNPPAGVTYNISISNGQKQTVDPNATIEFTTRRTGTHEIAISSVPAVCSLAGQNPVVVNVSQSEHVNVSFTITCPGSGD